ERAERSHGLLERRAGGHPGGHLFREAAAQLVPERIIAPGLAAVGHIDLHVVTAAARRAHGAEGKAPRGTGVDEVVAGGWHVRQDAKPAEGIDALEGAQGFRRYRLPADAVKAVAAGDEVAIDAVGAPVADSGDERRGLDVVEADVGGLVEGSE